MKNRLKMVINIAVIMILAYLIVAFMPNMSSKVYAQDMAPGTLSRDVNALDDNLYPGIKSKITDLQKIHPNYTFLLYYTGLNWQDVLSAEFQGHSYSPMNLVQQNDRYNGKWICPICGSHRYDNGSWCCASKDALAYMMDPRNSINESDVFQFKDLEGSDVSYDDIQRVVAGYGSYINNPEAISAIVDASKQYGINGYFLVSKIINEHGKNGSTLSNGNGYKGQYVGVYNYFNVGSFGNSADAIIRHGLEYAKNHGWTSIRASIFGGAEVVKDKYIKQYSQNTLYYQKFNVSGRSSLGSHQYQQNIMAAQTQGMDLKKYYDSNNSNMNYTFIIPLYKNMPKENTNRPDQTIKNTIKYEEGLVKNINPGSTLRVRSTPNGTAIGALNLDEPIKIISRAQTKVGGYYWDEIVSKKDGTYGYAARDVGHGETIQGLGAWIETDGTAVEPPKPEPKPEPEPEVKPDDDIVIPDEDFGNGQKPNIETDIKVDEKEIHVLPMIEYKELQEKFKDSKITAVDAEGKEIKKLDRIATGHKITIDDKTYTAIKKGDVNGDGKSNVVDSVIMTNTIKETDKLEGIYFKAALIKNRNKFYVSDVVCLLNYIKEVAQLSFEVPED